MDLNCDLGEGESRARTALWMLWITSANVACGGHAGNVVSMRASVRLAQRHGVRLGAHPGLADREHFGRAEVKLSADDLEALLLQQVSALERIARDAGGRLHHIKLHGALYHAYDRSAPLARRYVETAKRWWPRCLLYVRAGGLVERTAREAGVKTWGELFADRAYRDNGQLVPRGEPGALLKDLSEIRDRMETFLRSGRVRTQSGAWIKLAAQTICVHSDTPGGTRIGRLLAGIILEAR